MKHILLSYKRYTLSLACLIFLTLIQSSCKKDNQKPDYPTGSNENINSWILDSLKRYYYWSDALPSDPNINVNPKDFFNKVRNPADRFSYIIIPNDPSTNIPNNKNFGFDYTSVQEQGTGQTIGIIKLVLNDSPASRAGLKRGDYIKTINGRELTSANAAELQQEILNGDHFTLGLAELNNNTLVATRSVEVRTGVILDQKEISKVIENDGMKIGYLYLQDFIPGLATSLSNVFSGFKSAGITDLILDLRYNSGGQVAEAAGLCAMIAPGISFNTPFITYKGNKNGGQRLESIGSSATFDGTINFNALLQNSLSLKRIFILGTSATASASEVMINNLKPYMQVVLVGEITRGKDEASFKIFDARSPKQVQWEIHPIVYKLSNASGNGGYSAGINPNIVVNELASLPLSELGETADPLIKAAIARITGKAVASVNSSKVISAKGFNSGVILTDTRTQIAQSSVVITHH